MREILPPLKDCPQAEPCLFVRLNNTDCSQDETQLHPFYLAERVCPYSLAGRIDWITEQLEPTWRVRQRLGNLCLDLALAAPNETVAAQAFSASEQYFRGILDDPTASMFAKEVTSGVHNYLPIFRRRREEPVPSAETMRLAYRTIADSIKSTFGFAAFHPDMARGQLAERAVEALLARTGDPDLMPYPATNREDRGVAMADVPLHFLPCLHDSYVIYEGRKVPIQTKSGGRFSSTPKGKNFYYDLVAKVMYRDVCRKVALFHPEWEFRSWEDISRLVAQRLVAEAYGELANEEDRLALDQASDIVKTIVTDTAA